MEGSVGHITTAMRNMSVREMREGCGTETRGGSSKVNASNAGSNQNDVTGECGVASPEQETVESALAPSTAYDAQVTDMALPV